LWHAVDDVAASAFTGWILAVGHVVFAMTVTAGLVATSRASVSPLAPRAVPV